MLSHKLLFLGISDTEQFRIRVDAVFPCQVPGERVESHQIAIHLICSINYMRYPTTGTHRYKRNDKKYKWVKYNDFQNSNLVMIKLIQQFLCFVELQNAFPRKECFYNRP